MKRYQIKVQVKGVTKPPVWRRLSVPCDFTFGQLADIILVAFDWSGDHLWSFEDRGSRGGRGGRPNFVINPPDDNSFGSLFPGPPRRSPERFKLKDYFKMGQTKNMVFVYDFGDYWEHVITLEDQIETEEDDNEQGQAILLKGSGAPLPEDIGGVPMYEQLKELLQANDGKLPEEMEYYYDMLCLTEDNQMETAFTADMLRQINESLYAMRPKRRKKKAPKGNK